MQQELQNISFDDLKIVIPPSQVLLLKEIVENNLLVFAGAQN